MADEETRSVVEGYLADRDGYWLAEDVELELAGGRLVGGRRDAAGVLLARLGRERPGWLTVGDGRAAVEWEGGVVAVFEVDAGEIVAARLYQGFAKSSQACSKQGLQ